MTIPGIRHACSIGSMSGMALGLLVSSTASYAASGEKIGAAVSIINKVTVDFANQKRGLTAGDAVRQDELVEVSADSLGEFRLDDDTKLALGPGARLLLDKFVYDSDKKAGSIVVNFVKGTFRFMTGLATKSTYVIRTPTAAITVRGTIFDVFILPDNSTWLLLHEGAIEVRGARNVCRVLDRPGYVMRVSGAGSVGVPVNWRRFQARSHGFDAAFPFVARPPLVDPNPQLTRSAIVDAAFVPQRASSCSSAAPVVPPRGRRAGTPPPRPRDGLRRPNLDRDVEVIPVRPPRIRPGRVVRWLPPDRPPSRPGRRPDTGGRPPIGIPIGIGGYRPGGIRPGGIRPGGFRPGGFRPGGYRPGGFRPGGFPMPRGPSGRFLR